MKKSYTGNEIKRYLRRKLTREKYRHTLGVLNVSMKLAKKYKVDMKKTVLSALLHDAGKEVENNKKYLKSLKLDKYEKKIKALWHNKLGEIIARKEFGIKDMEILSAIRKHSTGDVKMSKLDKIIYISDIIERNRNFKGVDLIRRAAFLNLETGFICALAKKINYVLNKKGLIHPRSIYAWNGYVK
ncbi:MAG: bis(5'-nucleosyl)-tetraphosphatase (symmetrical) YqeK [Candidatus Firestonebacteria bacterium]